MKIFTYDMLSKFSHPVSAYLILACITYVDYLLGPQISTAVFYLLPVALMTLSGRQIPTYIFCIVATIAWFCSDVLSGQSYDSVWVYFWNSVVRLAIFVLVAKLVHLSIDRSRLYEHLAHSDELTGILNRRGFMEKAEEEFRRAKRFKRCFSVAFLDLDNFKSVNDDFGHHVGDRLLKDIAGSIKSNIRQIDYVGRLGGDEFAILFVETDQDDTKKAFNKCHTQLNELIKISEWPISISAGVVTYTGAGLLLSELLEKADAWMYQVKKTGKNNVVYKFDSELD